MLSLYEEIKNERLSEFENRYQKIQTDFDVYRKTEVPEGIDFSEKKRDAPIKDVELTQQITNTSEERKTQEVEISEKTPLIPTSIEMVKLERVHPRVLYLNQLYLIALLLIQTKINIQTKMT